MVKSDPMERDILMEAAPDTFFTADHYRGYPWVLARLSAAELDQIETPLRRAWLAAAPPRLVRQAATPPG